MPTYEYRCKDCNETLEVFQSFTDDSLTECPNCGGTLRKVFGNVGISFKGSGFYKTDSRSGSKTSSTSKSNGATTAGDNGSSSPSDKSGSSSSDTSTSSTDSTKSASSADSSKSSTAKP